MAGRPPLWPVVSVYVLGGLVVAALAWSHGTTVDVVVRGSGIVRPEGEAVRIAAETAGTLVAVRAREGARVRTGDVLFRLEDHAVRAERAALERQIELAQLQARDLERKRADLAIRRALELDRLALEAEAARDRLERTEAARRVALQSAAIDLAEARAQHRDAAALHAEGLISRRDLDLAGTSVERARVRHREAGIAPPGDGELRAAERNRDLAEARFASERRDLDAGGIPLETRLAELHVQLERIREEEARRTLRAPAPGIVTFAPPLHPGERVAAGALLASIAAGAARPVVEARIDHRESADIRPEQRVRLVLDEGRILDGRILSVSPDVQPNESGPPAYRALVEPAEPLRLGLGLEVHIVTRRATLLSLMFNKVTRPFRDWSRE